MEEDVIVDAQSVRKIRVRSKKKEDRCLGKSIRKSIDVVDGLSGGLRNVSLRFIPCIKGILKSAYFHPNVFIISRIQAENENENSEISHNGFRSFDLEHHKSSTLFRV